MTHVHFHTCPKSDCRHIWSHDRDKIPEGQHDEAHTCPKCKEGRDWWAKETMREAVEAKKGESYE